MYSIMVWTASARYNLIIFFFLIAYIIYDKLFFGEVG